MKPQYKKIAFNAPLYFRDEFSYEIHFKVKLYGFKKFEDYQYKGINFFEATIYSKDSEKIYRYLQSNQMFLLFIEKFTKEVFEVDIKTIGSVGYQIYDVGVNLYNTYEQNSREWSTNKINNEIDITYIYREIELILKKHYIDYKVENDK